MALFGPCHSTLMVCTLAAAGALTTPSTPPIPRSTTSLQERAAASVCASRTSTGRGSVWASVTTATSVPKPNHACICSQQADMAEPYTTRGQVPRPNAPSPAHNLLNAASQNRHLHSPIPGKDLSAVVSPCPLPTTLHLFRGTDLRSL